MFTVCGQCPSLHDRWCLLYVGSARRSTTGDVYCMRAVTVTPRQVMFTVCGQCPSLHAEGLNNMSTTARQWFLLVWAIHVSVLLVFLLSETKQIWLPIVVLFVTLYMNLTLASNNCTVLQKLWCITGHTTIHLIQFLIYFNTLLSLMESYLMWVQQFLKFIFGIKLYMFHTVPLSIIRSFSLYTQQTCMTYTIAVCTVKNSWWWTEELSETCRVLFQK